MKPFNSFNPLKILFIVALVSVISGTFTACKKNKDKKLSCKISTIRISPINQVLRLSYNSDGKISDAVSGATTESYAYSGNTVTTFSYNAGSFSQRTLTTLNAAGLAINVRTEFNLTGTQWKNNVFEYNGEEVFRLTSTTSSGGSPAITTYAWVDHNLVSYTDGSTQHSFQYYQDKPGQAGDYFSLSQLTLGYEVYRTKNLVKSFDGTVITYDFRSDGNISSLSANDGNTASSFNYEYECK